MIKYYISVFFIIITNLSFAQSNPYGLKLVDNIKEYKESISANSNNQLVEISKYIPGIKLDIRYATTNNFAKKAVYSQARCFVRLPLVKALQEVQAELKTLGLGLKIFDAYRPYSVTVKFFELIQDTRFVADPKNGSRHNRGCAIDLTLIKLRTGKELKMPTDFDSFKPEAAINFKELPKEVIKNRDLLRSVMEKHGFTALNDEWWHFDFKGWKDYELMDISFENL